MNTDDHFEAFQIIALLLYSPQKEKATCGPKTRPGLRPFSFSSQVQLERQKHTPANQKGHAVSIECIL